jgi:hypothetical protein
VLAALRRRGRAQDDTSTVLVLATSRSPDRVELPGVAREARELASRYANVRMHLNDALGAATQEELPRFDVLHLASHTSIDDQRPWNSGFLLQPVTESGAPLRLRASEILGLRLNARLCVLSGCESAAGKTLTGEGVQSLAGAFLCAGVPTVVATVWPVDDATTERLMQRFYRALESGKGAANALCEAQNALRKEPRTRAPFYWSGFVLVGEPETHVALERRRTVAALPSGWWKGGIAALMLCGFVVSFVLGLRRHSTWIQRTRWVSATSLVLLASWFLFERARTPDSEPTLRSGPAGQPAGIQLRAMIDGHVLSWSEVAKSDSYVVQFYTPELTALGRAREVAGTQLDLSAGDSPLPPASGPVLVRVVAMRAAYPIATSNLLAFRRSS